MQGAELQVLKSIDWTNVKFDVMAVETDPANRPVGYAAEVTKYLLERGYVNATMQQGRNTCEPAVKTQRLFTARILCAFVLIDSGPSQHRHDHY